MVAHPRISVLSASVTAARISSRAPLPSPRLLTRGNGGAAVPPGARTDPGARRTARQPGAGRPASFGSMTRCAAHHRIASTKVSSRGLKAIPRSRVARDVSTARAFLST